MMEVRAYSGQFYVFAAAVLWGTTGTAQALAPHGVEPVSIGTLRLVIGSLGLLVLALLRGGLARPHTWPHKPLLLAALGVAAYQISFFGGVARTGVAVGTVIAIGSAPVMAGVLGWWARGERPCKHWLGATLLAVAGCILLMLPGEQTRIDPVGVLLALGAGLTYSLYALASKELLERYAPDAVMAMVFCLGALFLLPLLFVVDLRWIREPVGITIVLYLGLIVTALSYAWFARGLRQILTATAVTLSLAEPLTASVLGIALLGEQLTPVALLGILFIGSGLVLVSFPGSIVKITGA